MTDRRPSARVHVEPGGLRADNQEHKPDAALDLVESASPGPYLELFCRRPRFGWDSWGWGYEMPEVTQ